MERGVEAAAKAEALAEGDWAKAAAREEALRAAALAGYREWGESLDFFFAPLSSLPLANCAFFSFLFRLCALGLSFAAAAEK